MFLYHFHGHEKESIAILTKIDNTRFKFDLIFFLMNRVAKKLEAGMELHVPNVEQHWCIHFIHFNRRTVLLYSASSTSNSLFLFFLLPLSSVSGVFERSIFQHMVAVCVHRNRSTWNGNSKIVIGTGEFACRTQAFICGVSSPAYGVIFFSLHLISFLFTTRLHSVWCLTVCCL